MTDLTSNFSKVSNFGKVFFVFREECHPELDSGSLKYFANRLLCTSQRRLTESISRKSSRFLNNDVSDSW